MFESRVIVALDVESQEEALGAACELKGACAAVKVGKELFTMCGPQIVRKIEALGVPVFLDLKYHDIPTTVAKASIQATKLGVNMFNMHALGGLEMMRKAKESVQKHILEKDVVAPKMIGVTILTSHGYDALVEIGFFPGSHIELNKEEAEKQRERLIKGLVLHLARLAQKAGLHGVVASPVETALIRKECGNDFLIVTPGVRPALSDANDQKRIMTPGEAILAGSNYLVIGRPIMDRPKGQRIEALLKINEEVNLVLAKK